MEITSAVSEAYQYVTDKLSLNDRIRLVTLLRNDVSKVEVAVIDKSGEKFGVSQIETQ